MTYSAMEVGRFYPVLKDDGTAYATPHWVDADLNGVADDPPSPAAYRREATMVVTSEIMWNGTGQNLEVKGEGPLGYDFYAKMGVNDPNDSLTLTGNTLTFKDTAGASFKETIEHFDTFDINWSVSADGGATWIAAGTTNNQVYTFLDTPTTTLYHTVAHLATRAPAGLPMTDPAHIVDFIWWEFADKEVRRVDGSLLSYYGFRDENDNGTWDAGVDTDFNDTGSCTITSTGGLLANLNGQCNSWAEFFADTLGAHGITAQRVAVVSKDDAFAIAAWATAGAGPWFIVDDDAGVDGSAAVAPAAGEAADTTGLGGQGHSPNPPSRFGNHWIVLIDGKYYDPSYGIGPYWDLRAYEEDAFAGTIVDAPAGGSSLFEKPADDGDPNDEKDLIASYIPV